MFSFRSKDSHRLLKRLDAVYKQAVAVEKEQKWTEEQVTVLLKKLVQLFFVTADSIKLLRAVEKV